jgi:hypothetical protein
MKKLIIGLNEGIAIFLLIILSFTSPVKAQTNSDGSSPQFLYPDFTKSTIRMKNGQSQSSILNYNTVSEKMVYQKDDKLYDMVNTEMIDTVFLQDSKFVPVGKVFYEVLLVAPVALFVQYKGELVPPGTPAGYGGTSQVSNTKLMSTVQLSSGYYNLKLPADYLVITAQVYWIRKDSSMNSFMKEKQFLRIFPDKEAELKQFIKQNRIKFDNQSDMVKLAESINEMTGQGKVPLMK